MATWTGTQMPQAPAEPLLRRAIWHYGVQSVINICAFSQWRSSLGLPFFTFSGCGGERVSGWWLHCCCLPDQTEKIKYFRGSNCWLLAGRLEGGFKSPRNFKWDKYSCPCSWSIERGMCLQTKRFHLYGQQWIVLSSSAASLAAQAYL